MYRTLMLLALAALAWNPTASAQTPAEPEAVPPGATAVPDEEGPGEPDDEEGMTVEEFLATLNFKTGTVDIADGRARVDMPEGYRLLEPEDTERVLQAWGNPPGQAELLMIVPPNEPLFERSAFAVLVAYVDEGHVTDEDAEDIDYDELLEDMQDSTAAGNDMRVEQGYPPIELIGWAEPPHYDAETHKIYWAKDLQFGDVDRTLNYDVRVLGREGYLELSAVSELSSLDRVRAAMPTVMQTVDFLPGHQYTDFDPSTDRTAAYGLAALVAGGVAAKKVGLLKGLFAALVAGKKFVIIAAAAILAFLARIFRRGSKTDASEE